MSAFPYLSVLICCAFTLSGCQMARSHQENDAQQAANSNASHGSPQSRSPIDSTFAANQPKAKEAWLSFTRDERYRWAEPNDFRIPGWALGAHGRDIEKAIHIPLEAGDINHDGAYNDFAVIVVDTRKESWDRFAIVIFNEPKGNQGQYETHWLFRDVDLSRTVLDWSSEGLGLSEYREEGAYLHCFVKWDSQRKTYTCDLVDPR